MKRAILISIIGLMSACTKRPETVIEVVASTPTPIPVVIIAKKQEQKPTPIPIKKFINSQLYLIQYQSVETDSGIIGYPVGTPIKQNGTDFYAPDGQKLESPQVSADITRVRELMLADQRSQRLVLPSYDDAPTPEQNAMAHSNTNPKATSSNGNYASPLESNHGTDKRQNHSSGIDLLRKEGKLIH